MKKYRDFIPPCGMFCGKCRWYTSKKKNPCPGAGVLCRERECLIMKCTAGKGIRYCIYCSDFPCKIMKRNIKRWMMNYNQDVVDNMRKIEQIGEEAFIKEMNEKILKENTMNDEFLKTFPWLTEIFSRPIPDFFMKNAIEREIISKLTSEWGKRDTIELLNELSDKYGDMAGQTVEKLLEINIINDWKKVGEKEAHNETVVEDFIRVLWEPLNEIGFEYTYKTQKGKTLFCVKKCPNYELAKKTGMYKWMYHLVCSTDYFSSKGFSDRLGFSRTKTLVTGDDCCDHCYFVK